MLNKKIKSGFFLIAAFTTIASFACTGVIGHGNACSDTETSNCSNVYACNNGVDLKTGECESGGCTQCTAGTDCQANYPPTAPEICGCINAS